MYTMRYTTGTAILAVLVSLGQTHMALQVPTPFGSTDPWPTSPLSSTGSDYPCRNDYTSNGMNNIVAGEDNVLSFYGSTTHGGGACQVAISLDENPTADSVFKLIKVFEGGCPVASAVANLTYTIPKEMPNGKMTFAWTWYNQIGNRELYMGCAPVTLTGGADNNDYYNTLPNQYLVNMPPADCGVPDGMNLIIPNPGSDVVTASDFAGKAATATGPSCAASAAAQTQGVSSGDESAGSERGTTSSISSSASIATPAPMVSEDDSSPTTSISSAATSTPSVVTPTYAAATTEAVVSVTPAAPIATPTGDASSATTSSSSSADTSSGTCSEEGAVVCNGTSQFGICNQGSVVWQSVAAGTVCQNGQITKRNALRDVRVRRSVQRAGRFM